MTREAGASLIPQEKTPTPRGGAGVCHCSTKAERIYFFRLAAFCLGAAFFLATAFFFGAAFLAAVFGAAFFFRAGARFEGGRFFAPVAFMVAGFLAAAFFFFFAGAFFFVVATLRSSETVFEHYGWSK